MRPSARRLRTHEAGPEERGLEDEVRGAGSSAGTVTVRGREGEETALVMAKEEGPMAMRH